MPLIVQKFGGSSVADPEKIHRCAARAVAAKREGKQVVVVVSAMGKTTDVLVDLANRTARHPPKREMDQLLATGEVVTIALFAMAISEQGYDAVSFTGPQINLLTDDAFTKARIQSIDAGRIHKELDAGKIVVVAGFQGVTPTGELTTLGRGGSNATLVALGGGAEGRRLRELHRRRRRVHRRPADRPERPQDRPHQLRRDAGAVRPGGGRAADAGGGVRQEVRRADSRAQQRQ